MNRRQLEIEHIELKQSDLFHQHYAVNSVGLNSMETSKPRLFDRIDNAFLGAYQEVFNACDPSETKIFIYVKTVSNLLAKQIGIEKPKPMLLQLIPINAEESVH